VSVVAGPGGALRARKPKARGHAKWAELTTSIDQELATKDTCYRIKKSALYVVYLYAWDNNRIKLMVFEIAIHKKTPNNWLNGIDKDTKARIRMGVSSICWTI
jgi:hypothetical protein